MLRDSIALIVTAGWIVTWSDPRFAAMLLFFAERLTP